MAEEPEPPKATGDSATTAAPPLEGAARARRRRPGQEYYRPWASRLAAKPRSVGEDGRLWPENREGYRRFQNDFPGYPAQPNHRDRDTETTAVLVVIATALGTVALGGLAATRLGIDGKVKDQLVGFFIVVCAPGILALLWVYRIALQHLSDPVRDIGGPKDALAEEAWMCHSLVWYLLFTPAFTALNLVTQITMVVGMYVRTQRLPLEADMSRATRAGVSEMTDFERVQTGAMMIRKELEKFVQYEPRAGHITRRIVMMVLNFVALAIGFYLTSSGARPCYPEVWWTAFVFTVSVTTLLVTFILALTAASCVNIHGEDILAMKHAFQAQYGGAFHENAPEPFALGAESPGYSDSADDPPPAGGSGFGTIIMQPTSSQGPTEVVRLASQGERSPTMRWEGGGGGGSGGGVAAGEFATMPLDATLRPATSLPGSGERMGPAMY